MTSKAKTKGNTAERELCAMFRKVFGGSFIRVPNSGAYIGGKNAHRKDNLSESQVFITKGDIIPPDDMPRLVLESKFYSDFLFHQLYANIRCPQLEEWIQQTIDCVEDHDLWFVAFKINRRGWYICFDNQFKHHFELRSYAHYVGDNSDYTITSLDEFIKDNRDIIKELTKPL